MGVVGLSLALGCGAPMKQTTKQTTRVQNVPQPVVESSVEQPASAVVEQPQIEEEPVYRGGCGSR